MWSPAEFGHAHDQEEGGEGGRAVHRGAEHQDDRLPGDDETDAQPGLGGAERGGGQEHCRHRKLGEGVQDAGDP